MRITAVCAFTGLVLKLAVLGFARVRQEGRGSSFSRRPMSKRMGLFLATMLCATLAQAQEYAIHAGTMFDGTGGAARHNTYIVVKGGRITDITAKRPRKMAVKEFGTDTILPG